MWCDRTGIEGVYIATAKIEIPQEQIAEFCRRNHIRRLSLFGSVVRGDFRPESDVDVLVEFEPGYTPGLRFFAMQAELSQIFGRPVDLNTRQWLSPYFREDVENEQIPIYVTRDLPPLVNDLEHMTEEER